MPQDESKREMKLAIPSGLILGPIGLLVLITPLVAEVPAHQLKMDLLAGGILLAAGLICLALGLRRGQGRAEEKKEVPTDHSD